MWLKNGPFCNKVNFHKRAKSKVCFDFISQSHSNQLFSIPLCIKREKKRDKEWGKKIKKFFEESVSEKKEGKKGEKSQAEGVLNESWKGAERKQRGEGRKWELQEKKEERLKESRAWSSIQFAITFIRLQLFYILFCQYHSLPTLLILYSSNFFYLNFNNLIIWWKFKVINIFVET